jgi:preprotein translocase subunit SecG
MLFGILLFLFILVCIFLCLLILIQSDKGGGISGAIGGLSGASSFLGTQGTADALTKGTYIFGSVFLILCVLMTLFAPGGHVAKSGLQQRAEAQAITSRPASSFGIDEAEAEAATQGAGADAAAIFGGEVGEAQAPE